MNEFENVGSKHFLRLREIEKSLSINETLVFFIFLFLQTAGEWRTVFWITFLFYLIGSIVFNKLMKADRQEWDKVEGVSREPTEGSITPR